MPPRLPVRGQGAARRERPGAVRGRRRVGRLAHGAPAASSASASGPCSSASGTRSRATTGGSTGCSPPGRRSIPLVLEAQHASWFRDETLAALAAAGAVLCTTDLDEQDDVPDIRRTGPFLYLRLRRTTYTMRRWTSGPGGSSRSWTTAWTPMSCSVTTRTGRAPLRAEAFAGRVDRVRADRAEACSGRPRSSSVRDGRAAARRRLRLPRTEPCAVVPSRHAASAGAHDRRPVRRATARHAPDLVGGPGVGRHRGDRPAASTSRSRVPPEPLRRRPGPSSPSSPAASAPCGPMAASPRLHSSTSRTASQREASAACSGSRSRRTSARPTRRLRPLLQPRRRHDALRVHGWTRTTPTRADPGTEVVLLTVDQPYPNHNGGWIGFDNDGMLLLALGDGGAGGDPENRASNLDELLGKILRLDVAGAREGQPYGIPADNPFADGSGGRPEILHYGLRNPFRASDRPGDRRPLDRRRRARAPGRRSTSRRPEPAAWTSAGAAGRDGTATTLPAGPATPQASRCPSPSTSTAAGCCIIGGVVYRGSRSRRSRRLPVLGLLQRHPLGDRRGARCGASAVTLLETGRQISSIGTDAAGEVVLTDLKGRAAAARPGGQGLIRLEGVSLSDRPGAPRLGLRGLPSGRGRLGLPGSRSATAGCGLRGLTGRRYSASTTTTYVSHTTNVITSGVEV